MKLFSPIGFADGANYNTNIWNQWYMMPYAIGGWLGLGKDSYYGNASMHVEAIPTKFAYMMYDWQKDRRPSVTFMSPLMVMRVLPQTERMQARTGSSVLLL